MVYVCSTRSWKHCMLIMLIIGEGQLCGISWHSEVKLRPLKSRGHLSSHSGSRAALRLACSVSVETRTYPFCRSGLLGGQEVPLPTLFQAWL